MCSRKSPSPDSLSPDSLFFLHDESILPRTQFIVLSLPLLSILPKCRTEGNGKVCLSGGGGGGRRRHTCRRLSTDQFSTPTNMLKSTGLVREKTKTAVRSAIVISLMHTQRSNHFQFFPGKERSCSACHALFLRVQTKLEGEVRSK